MLEKYYEEIRQNINVRENLSLLRGQIKEKEAHTRLLNLVGDGSFLLALLQHEEPKVRKNAALLIGDLGLQEAVGSLFCAYKREATLFVRSSYLNALGRLDASEYLVELKGARDALAAAEVPENERKHRAEELGSWRRSSPALRASGGTRLPDLKRRRTFFWRRTKNSAV